MRARLVTALVLVAAVAAGLATLADADGGARGKQYRVELDSAFGLTEGGELKIGGVRAGKTSGFELTRREPYRVIVTVEVTEDGFDSLREDARCDVRQQSLIGEYFLDCDVGRAKRELPDGGLIPVERTSSTIPLDLINNIMRRPYSERWRLILSELGAGLAGRPDELNEVIKRAHPALRETNQTLAILARQNHIIRDFIENADRVSAAVEPVREDVAAWAKESSETADVQASRADELARYWNRLPRFLAELEPTMAQLERTADRQIPTLRRLRRAAPELEAFLARAEPFARASRGSLAALGEAASAGSKALDASSEEVAELRALAENAPRLGKPLRQFLQAIDDRRRSYEHDPEAELRAPPAPDKTAYQEGQGYTGMENLFNYIYWQTLGINGYDELGHLLRIVAFAGGPCTPYNAAPTKAVQEQCASWLGPYQPGVTDPDPTAGAQTAATRAERPEARRKGRRRVAQTGPGGAYNEAKPGERDLSKPQIVLPPGVQELVERLSAPLAGEDGAPRLAPGTADPDQALLDYLLGG